MPRKLKPVIVHVNQHVIKHNAKNGGKLPALTIKHPVDGTLYAHEVAGRGRVIDSNAQGRAQLSCGARVWMEFDRDDFEIVGPSYGWDQMRNWLWCAGSVALPNPDESPACVIERTHEAAQAA